MKISEPATDEISATFENIYVIDEDISANKLRKEDLKHNVALLEFMNKQCRRTLMSSRLKSAWMWSVDTLHIQALFNLEDVRGPPTVFIHKLK